jgi:hypothetical protein
VCISFPNGVVSYLENELQLIFYQLVINVKKRDYSNFL